MTAQRFHAQVRFKRRWVTVALSNNGAWAASYARTVAMHVDGDGRSRAIEYDRPRLRALRRRLRGLVAS